MLVDTWTFSGFSAILSVVLIDSYDVYYLFLAKPKLARSYAIFSETACQEEDTINNEKTAYEQVGDPRVEMVSAKCRRSNLPFPAVWKSEAPRCG